jgi:hypothetical protein
MSPEERDELVQMLLESSRLVKENQRLRGQPAGPEEPTEEAAEEVIDRLVELLADRNRRVAESN